MGFPLKKIVFTLIIVVCCLLSSAVICAERVVDLCVQSKLKTVCGNDKCTIHVNNQFPAPTLRFKEGDNVTLNVWNFLKEPTTVHWHGILLPWYMDGVADVTQRSIPPGCVFHYQFKLRQSGTYWYHAHRHFQEQDGLYGAFIVDPVSPPSYHYHKDFVIVLSDWSNLPGEHVFRNLKKIGDYYSPRFPLQASLQRFFYDLHKASPKDQKTVWEDYLSMQYTRMSIYDFSDVAYDAYLLNGKTLPDPWCGLVNVGDVVRLRFIGAAASTIYKVKIPCAVMTMVNVQGHDVTPYSVTDFTIAPGETYDVLVKIRQNNPYVIYAESSDTLGAAFGALITSPQQRVNFHVKPFPQPLSVMREMMANMMGHGGHDMSSMKHGANGHGSHDMSSMKHGAGGHGGHDMSQMTHGAHGDHAKMTHGNNSVYASHEMSNMQQHNSAMHHSANMSSDHSMHGMQHDKQQPVSGNEQPGNAGLSKMPDMSGMNMSHEMSMADMISMMLTGKQKIMSTTMSMGTKYQSLRSSFKTNNPEKPYTIIKMSLFGWMDRYIWFINGLPEYAAHPIVIEAGKRYRIIFTNASMMHHPMHIHGHFFIFRNGNGEYDPLLHTIDVAPGANVVADFDADEVGQWFFHCHHLYHMSAGMARVLQYSTFFYLGKSLPACGQITAFTPQREKNSVIRPCVDNAIIKHPQGHHAGFFNAVFLDAGVDPFNNIQKLTWKSLHGPDYNKLELYMEDAEINNGSIDNADIDIFYWRLIGQFWAIKGGVNYFYRPAVTPYWQPGIGIEGLMVFFIDTNLRIYHHSGSTKFDLQLARDTQLTNNFFIRTGIRSIIATKTVEHDEVGSGLNQMRYIIRPYYRIAPGLSLFAEYEHEQSFGAFRSLLEQDGEPATTDSITFGVMLIL